MGEVDIQVRSAGEITLISPSLPKSICGPYRFPTFTTIYPLGATGGSTTIKPT